MDLNISFAPAYENSVKIPTEDKGKTDVYIDDNISIGPDLPGILENSKQLSLSPSMQLLAP